MHRSRVYTELSVDLGGSSAIRMTSDWHHLVQLFETKRQHSINVYISSDKRSEQKISIMKNETEIVLESNDLDHRSKNENTNANKQ